MSEPSSKRFFEAIATKANKSNKGMRIMREWIGSYDGKVIQFLTDTEKFYLVISAEKMKVRDGEYPSPDLTFKGSSKLVSDVFTGKIRIGDAMKNWELVLIGAGHEGFALEKLVTTLMAEA